MTKYRDLKTAIFKILTRGSAQPLVAWTETIILSVLASMLWISGIQIDVSDSESLSLALHVVYTHEFFWPLVLILLISLRYGFTLGFVSAVLTILFTLIFYNYKGVYDFFSFKQSVGILLFAMITGEFRDAWDERLHRNDLDFDFMTRKLELFTQNYFMLRASHDQLEQRMAGQVVSLRSNISELETLNEKYPILGMSQEKRLHFIAPSILNLLSTIVGIEEAGLYTVENDVINPKPVTVAGNMKPLDLTDEMVKEMVETKTLMSPIDMYDNEYQCKYQLCVPFVDSTGKFIACVISSQVKFFTLTAQNIAILNLVASYSADMMSTGVIAPVIDTTQKNLFLKYLHQALSENSVRHEQSSLLICKGHPNKCMKVFDKTISLRRGADIYWKRFCEDGSLALVVLLPLTSLYQAQMYVDRVRAQFKREPIDENEIDIMGPIDVSLTNETLLNQLKNLGVTGEDITSYTKFD